MDKQWVEVELAAVGVAEAVLVVAVAQELAAGPVVVAPEPAAAMVAVALAVTTAVITRERPTLPRNHHRRRGGPLSLARLNKARRRARY
jgi:hypothetical protein